MPVTDGISKPDRRSASACVACRLSKVKCDLPETGVCIRCTRLGLVCVKEDLQELCVTEAAHELPRAGDRMDKSEENGAQPDIGAKRGETANLCKAFLDKFGAFRGSWTHIESDARQLVDELVSQASDHGAQATAFTLASLRNVLDARLSKKQRKEKNNLTNEQRAVWAQVMTLELIEFTPSKYCQSSADVHTCVMLAVQAEAAAARAEAAAALKESARLSELLSLERAENARLHAALDASVHLRESPLGKRKVNCDSELYSSPTRVKLEYDQLECVKLEWIKLETMPPLAIAQPPAPAPPLPDPLPIELLMRDLAEDDEIVKNFADDEEMIKGLFS